MRRLRRDAVAAGFALTGGPAPAFAAAVVDVAAKPYMVGGGWIVGLIFAGLGGFLLCKGIAYRRSAEAMSAWQTVEGEVLESTVRKRVDRGYDGADITRYIPEVRYAYKLGGILREGTTVRIGLGDFGYMSERQARGHAGRYPVGARVGVRCDPQNADVAVLEGGQVGGGNKIVAGSI